MKKVFVYGSINMDLVMRTKYLPKKGETVIGYGFIENQGGKGANQAVACAKLGCNTHFIGAVGDDYYGKKLIDSVSSYGVNTYSVQTIKGVPSGKCIIITSDEDKDNMLVIEMGANEHIDPVYANKHLRDNSAAGDIFVAQLETNIDDLLKVSKRAKEYGLYTILNPAPARDVDKELFKYFDLVIPNETEAEKITGITINNNDDIKKTYERFKALGVKELIITLGANGSVYLKDNYMKRFGAYQAVAIDTTSAGDTFIGALSSKLSEGLSIEEAIPFASMCSSITVSRRGAAVSIPTLEEVKRIFNL